MKPCSVCKLDVHQCKLPAVFKCDGEITCGTCWNKQEKEEVMATQLTNETIPQVSFALDFIKKSLDRKADIANSIKRLQDEDLELSNKVKEVADKLQQEFAIPVDGIKYN